MEHLLPKATVYFIAKNKIQTSKIKFLIVRPSKTLYHLESGLNVKAEILFPTIASLTANLVEVFKTPKKPLIKQPQPKTTA